MKLLAPYIFAFMISAVVGIPAAVWISHSIHASAVLIQREGR